ncbi:hypothetical protein G6F70_001971 [Rhizopus microsporus]|nr:hypothetical protein G6F71_002117 [Rhizopus microsporus]KAG1202771.1 hypothetical protein G6F70_001971 [Rhizopus microsporus]KAG1214375.1 hypothetical protein G6F69_001984 [Rhizopus microsporus]KAG1236931.1 hypothetical protein G6F67_001597 [Rhizopus microsporus]KAG1267382.1 hypothetical protein G6F68_001985 [Rhizopus microsporus]
MTNILGSNKQKSKTNTNHSSRLAMYANNNSNSLYRQPQMSYSAEYIPAPPPYDSPIPTPSTSWTSEMSAFAEKIKEDVTNTFKSSKHTAVDRHSISQGMKLISIAADEYDQGNESIALDIYLTGVDKLIMALPNKSDTNTKRILHEKLTSVEERVGILQLPRKKNQENNDNSSNSENDDNGQGNMLLSRIVSTLSSVSSKAYAAAINSNSVPDSNSSDTTTTTTTTTITATGTTCNSTTRTTFIGNTTNTTQPLDDPIIRFKKFGQYLTEWTVTLAVLIKQSPIPDKQYCITEKAQDLGIQCLKIGLEADQHYRLHEFITEGIYMFITAGLKAIIAFKETSSYKN